MTPSSIWDVAKAPSGDEPLRIEAWATTRYDELEASQFGTYWTVDGANAILALRC